MSDVLERLTAALADRYAIQRELGRGGMATVYLAEDTKLERKVAIKVLKPELAHALGPERFLREIKITARLTHPHILPLLDSGEAEGFLFYVMPFVEGESLRDRLDREKQLPIEDALQITREVAAALGYAHSHDVVHRDIKPENILLQAGQAVVADFGIARAITAAGGDRVTETGLAIGTPTYMSPEQASGASDLDGRTDLYALAAVTYEMLAGEPPYTGQTAQAIIAKSLTDAVPHVRRLRETVPETVDATLSTALAKTPSDRFRTAAQFSEALERGHTPPTAASPSDSSRIRRRSLWVGAPVGLLVIALLAWWIGIRLPGNSTTGAPQGAVSIAVLPFQNLSANPDNEYFGDGLAEELLNALAKVPDLQVAARTSSFSFKGKSETIGSIGRQLNVGAILEGSVRHSGTRIRIAAQLINVSDGFQLWSETYDRELTDIFTVQDAIARAIVAALKVELLGDIGSQLATRHAANVEAYNLYLRGRYQWHQRGPADVLDAAIQYFEQAIEADSSYAPAYAGLADAYAVLPTYAPVSAREAFDRAHAAASKALDLDSTLAEAHASLGYVMDNRWEWIGAEQAYRRAIALNPNYATAHQWYGELLTWTGRAEEAVSETRRAYELDPLSPVINVMYAEALYYADSLEAALRQMQQALELSPNITPALRDLAFWYLAEQRLDEAFRTGLRWIEAGDHEREPFQQVWEGITGARPRAEALDALLAVENSANLDPYDYALLYAALGNDDKALDWLETAAEQKSTFMRLVAVQKLFADFRSQPRFRAVLSATGLY